jgi:hypothetical protein
MLDLDGAVAVLIVVIAAAGGTGILVSRRRGRPHIG